MKKSVFPILMILVGLAMSLFALIMNGFTALFPQRIVSAADAESFVSSNNRRYARFEFDRVEYSSNYSILVSYESDLDITNLSFTLDEDSAVPMEWIMRGYVDNYPVSFRLPISGDEQSPPADIGTDYILFYRMTKNSVQLQDFSSQMALSTGGSQRTMMALCLIAGFLLLAGGTVWAVLDRRQLKRIEEEAAKTVGTFKPASAVEVLKMKQELMKNNTNPS